MGRPLRSVVLIFGAKVAEIWLHPVAFVRGKRRRPKTFDDLRALGLLEPQHQPANREPKP